MHCKHVSYFVVYKINKYWICGYFFKVQPLPVLASSSTGLWVFGEVCMQVPCTVCWLSRVPAAPQTCFQYQCRIIWCEWWSSTWCRWLKTRCRRACKWGTEPSRPEKSATPPPRSECTAGSACAPVPRPDFLARWRDEADICPSSVPGWCTKPVQSCRRSPAWPVKPDRTPPRRWNCWGTLACKSSTWFCSSNSLKAATAPAHFHSSCSNRAPSSYSTRKRAGMQTKAGVTKL